MITWKINYGIGFNLGLLFLKSYLVQQEIYSVLQKSDETKQKI